jgi:arylsulfatase A-like enzyme
MPEDITVPAIFYGRDFTSATQIDKLSIIDIAPTIADVLEIKKPVEWEGKSIL